MTIYRKIWETHFGAIPKDKFGRTYEIHHIDGNHSNNDINNLKCVSIQEHYDIHHSQEDWYACYLIAQRSNLSPDIISENSKKTQKQRIENGTHHFLNSEYHKFHASIRIKNGTHNFNSQTSKKTQKQRIENGTHNFLNSEFHKNRELKRIENGTHHFLSGEIQRKTQKQRIENGTHNFLNPKTYICPHCKKLGKGGIMFRFHFDKCKLKNRFDS